MHLLAALLHPDQQVVRSLLTQLGVNPAQILKAAEEGLNVLPKVSGGETTISPELNQVLETAQTEAERMKDQYVSVEHLLLALLKVKSRAQTLLEALGISEKEVLAGAAESARRPARHRPEPRRQVPGPGALRPRPGRAGAERQDGPGHRPRFRNPPRHAGPQPPHQEQPGLDRRPGRGQDRHRRGAGPAHRLGRRARKPAKSPVDRARHGRTRRRHQVPRRIRRAAQGRSQRRHPVGRPDHPLHRRAAPGRRRRQGRRGDGRRQPA